ncbi:MAG: lipoate--protein ligase family protein [Candidatus Aminicenantaceae bacterium]
MKKDWYLIIDRTPQKGSWNMAVDDYMFQSLREEPTTYLRFYRWNKPTVSIGYSQNAKKVVDLDFCRKRSIEIVRRITGGKLVLHHKEVTYTVCSSDTDIFSQKLMDSYKLISEALNRGLQRMGIESQLAKETPSEYVRGALPCFSHPAQNEIEVEGKKIIGSAQKRKGKKFIQHGSVPLEKEEGLLKSVSLLDQKGSSVKMTSLTEELGKRVDFDWAVEHLISGMSDYFCIRLNPKAFSTTEQDAIRKIQEERYDNPDWTFAY